LGGRFYYASSLLRQSPFVEDLLQEEMQNSSFSICFIPLSPGLVTRIWKPVFEFYLFPRSQSCSLSPFCSHMDQSIHPLITVSFALPLLFIGRKSEGQSSPLVRMNPGLFLCRLISPVSFSSHSFVPSSSLWESCPPMVLPDAFVCWTLFWKIRFLPLSFWSLMPVLPKPAPFDVFLSPFDLERNELPIITQLDSVTSCLAWFPFKRTPYFLACSPSRLGVSPPPPPNAFQ